jgi:hypothetical protein
MMELTQWQTVWCRNCFDCEEGQIVDLSWRDPSVRFANEYQFVKRENIFATREEAVEACKENLRAEIKRLQAKLEGL